LGNNTKNIIDINGKRYDADSGAVIKSLDGFRPVKSVPAAPLAGPAKPLRQDVRPARTVHTPAAHIAPHKPQKAATLMRSAVHKPDLRTKRIVSQSPAHTLTKISTHQIPAKFSHATIDPRREKRAKRVMQSPAVSRFGNLSTVNSLSASSSLASQQLPPQPLSSKQAPLSQPSIAASLPKAASHHRQPSDIPVNPIKHVTKEPDIFLQALARATSHEQPRHPAPGHRSKKRGRLISVLSGGLVVLLAIGTFVYFNAPELSLRMASSRAGFEARLPNYSPTGFTFGNLTYSPGNVTISYKDGQNELRRFDITQRVSTWDSEGLLSNFVSGAASAHQTYERAGRTVYLYGNNTATWVDSGIWYTIDGSNALTKNQVLDMAGSL
jgi:hypothetical protein